MTAVARIVVGGSLKKPSTSNFRPVGAGPTSDQDALRVRRMSKTFPGTRALVDVDLTVRAGEVHAVVGQNGSGKSTLIKVLAGYHDADPGASVEVGGRPFQRGSSLRAHAAGMRFVHQDLGLVAALDAVDNLALGSVTRPGWAEGSAGAARGSERLPNSRASVTRSMSIGQLST